jgi:flagellar FliJ protein
MIESTASAASTPALRLLLQRAEQLRDRLQSALRQADDQAGHARTQCAQLQEYRSEYQVRWSAQFHRGATMEILMCYRSFMQRLDQALVLQSRQADLADARRAQARSELIDAERRVAAVGKLLQRRAAERAHAQRQHEQKQTDELAQRMHRGRAAAMDQHPDTTGPAC